MVHLNYLNKQFMKYNYICVVCGSTYTNLKKPLLYNKCVVIKNQKSCSGLLKNI